MADFYESMQNGLGWVVPDDFNMVKAIQAVTTGQLVAFNPKTGKAQWTVNYPTPWNGGTMTTAGNLVFQGDAMGKFNAYAADTGKLLYSLDVQSGVLTGASTYLVDGEQYVAFMTSKGGAFPLPLAAGSRYPELALALARGEFEVHYQPQVDLTGLVPGTRYWFRVRARNASCCACDHADHPSARPAGAAARLHRHPRECAVPGWPRHPTRQQGRLGRAGPTVPGPGRPAAGPLAAGRSRHSGLDGRL